MNPLDWEAFFRNRTSSRDAISFVPLWTRQLSGVPQLLLDMSTRRAVVDTLHRVGSVLSNYVTVGETMVLVYRITLANSASLAILRLTNPQSLQRDDDDDRVQVTLMTLQGEPQPTLEELYTTQGDGQVTDDHADRDFALTMTRTLAFNTFLGQPQPRQHTNEEIADRGQEVVDRQLERSQRPSSAVAHIVRQLAIGKRDAVYLLDKVRSVLVAQRRNESESLGQQIIAGLVAQMDETDDLYEATRIVTDFYGLAINVVERYMPVPDWPNELLYGSQVGTIHVVSEATVAGILRDVRSAFVLLTNAGLIGTQSLAFAVADDQSDAESVSGLVVLSSDGVALVQYGRLVGGETVVRRTTLLADSGSLLTQVAPRDLPVPIAPGTRLAPRLVAIGGSRSIPAQQYSRRELALENVDPDSMERGRALFRFISPLMQLRSQTANESTIMQSLALLALARSLANTRQPEDVGVLGRVYLALPEEIRERVRRVVTEVYKAHVPVADNNSADSSSMSRSVAQHTTNSAVRPDFRSDEPLTMPALLARQLLYYLPYEQHASLRAFNELFDREVRAERPEMYAEAFRDAYPEIAALFDNNLPPWADFPQSDAAALLERVLHDELRAKSSAASKAGDDLSRISRIAESDDDQQFLQQRELKTRLESERSTLQTMINQLSRRNLLSDMSVLSVGEIERSNENRAWQLLFRSVNALLSHPRVVRLLRLSKSLQVDPRDIKLVDSERIVSEFYQPLHVLFDAAARTGRPAELQMQQLTTPGFTALPDITTLRRPRLSGRYYVWRHHVGTHVNSLPATRTSYAGDGDIPVHASQVSLRYFGSILAVDENGLIVDADNSSDTFQVVEPERAVIATSPQHGARVVMRLEEVHTVFASRQANTYSNNRLSQDSRISSSIVKEKPVFGNYVTTESLRDALDNNRAVEESVIVVAADHALLDVLRTLVYDIPALKVVSREETPQLYAAIRESLLEDHEDLFEFNFQDDPVGLSAAVDDYMVQMAPTMKPHEYSAYARILDRSQSARTKLLTGIDRAFEEQFGTVQSWIATAPAGKFTALDYHILLILYTHKALELATDEATEDVYDDSLAGVIDRRDLPEEICRHMEHLYAEARVLAGKVRASGFDAIRDNSTKRAEFLMQMDALGIVYPNVFGDEKQRVRTRDDNDNKEINKRRK